jgi:hypothetical protein
MLDVPLAQNGGIVSVALSNDEGEQIIKILSLVY